MKSKSPPHEVIRTGVMNNFDHTDAEFNHLEQFTADHRSIFVNSSAHTTIDSRLPSVVTVNPDVDTFLPLKGHLSNVKALRVKVYPGLAVMDFKAQRYPEHIPVLITGMRFRGTDSLIRFVDRRFWECYEWRGNWYRLTPGAWAVEIEYWKDSPIPNPVSVCDESGNGCPDCMNCSHLTYDTKDCILKGLNLSTSGEGGRCTHSCPDCFAKSLLYGGWPAVNRLTINSKQKGKK